MNRPRLRVTYSERVLPPLPTYTIRFPYRDPDLTVRASGEVQRFSDLPDGALFIMLEYPDRVHEKLGDTDAACLLPWEDETGVVVGDPWCHVLEKTTLS